MNKDPGKIQHAEKELSQLYASLQAPEPAEATDEIILHFAKQRTLVKPVPVSKPRINWTGGFSVAASIFAVSVLYWTQFAPSGDLTNKPEQEVVIASESSISLTSHGDNLAIPAQVQEPQVAADLARSHLVNASASVDNVGEEHLSSPFLEAEVPSLARKQNALVNEDTDIETQQAEGVVAEIKPPESSQAENAKLADDIVLSMKNGLRPVVSLSAKCKVSVDSGYRLSNTPLAGYIDKWSRDDKVWLTEQLNSFTPPTTMRASYKGNAPEVLNIDGFDTAYQKTIDSLKNCKQPHDPTR